VEITIFGCDVDEADVFRERAPFFGVTPVITSAAPTPETAHLARGSRCISVSHKSPISHQDLSALNKVGVRYISTRSIGHDHIDAAYARSVGMTVEPVAYSPGSVADFTLMLMLMAVRQAKAGLLRSIAGDYRLPQTRGRELRDLTVGVVGTGRIGSAVVDRLRGFECRIVAYDRATSAVAEYVSLDELLRISDIVTLHTPLDETTHHLLDGAAFERMKAGAYLINTARGALIDTAGLVAALESGHLAGAALDVVEGEQGVFYTNRRHQKAEATAFQRLTALPNVVITPHTAYYTDHALTDTVVNGLINCLRFEKGLRHD
jgi:D-specific alpha-keto acid dehydrogenase